MPVAGFRSLPMHVPHAFESFMNAQNFKWFSASCSTFNCKCFFNTQFLAFCRIYVFLNSTKEKSSQFCIEMAVYEVTTDLGDSNIKLF